MQGAFTAWQWFIIATPFLAVAAVWWLVSQTDRIVNLIFPDLEWERSLGWLNIRAERRAKTGLRWIRFGIYVVLFDALFGIIWGAKGLHLLQHWSDPWIFGGAVLRLVAFASCLGIWIAYLGCGLLPRLRAERDEAQHRKFRREVEEIERARGIQPSSPIYSALRKPGRNAPLVSLTPDRVKTRR